MNGLTWNSRMAWPLGLGSQQDFWKAEPSQNPWSEHLQVLQGMAASWWLRAPGEASQSLPNPLWPKPYLFCLKSTNRGTNDQTVVYCFCWTALHDEWEETIKACTGVVEPQKHVAQMKWDTEVQGTSDSRNPDTGCVWTGEESLEGGGRELCRVKERSASWLGWEQGISR